MYDSTLFSNFIQYQKLNFRLAACDETKSPRILGSGGWYNATSDTGKWMEWANKFPNCLWGNFPESYCVLDCDVKHGGTELLAKLQAKYGPLPATPCVKSGGGGKHYYFQLPRPDYKGEQIRDDDGKPNNGLEVICRTKGVIIPPSIHPETKVEYQWEIAPWECEMAEFPQWLLNRESKVEEPLGWKRSSVLEHNDDDPYSFTMGGGGFDSLGKLPKGDRNEPITKTIVQEKLSVTSEAVCLEKGLAWASENGYDPDEMRRKVRSIYGNGKFEAKIELLPPDTFCPTVPTKPKPNQNEEKVGYNSECSSLKLSSDAFHGPIGEIVRSIKTEGDEAGLLISMLTIFGSVIGRNPRFEIAGDSHHTNLFCCMVGTTSAGKGTAWGCAKRQFMAVEPEWASQCVASGLSSGEGLIRLVADAQTELTRDGKFSVPPVKDKRALVYESEFGKLVQVKKREGNTLPETMKDAWDGIRLQKITNGDPITATDHHISIVACGTPSVIRKSVSKTLDLQDGWSNRFLWVCVKGGEDLPDGGNASQIAEMNAERLKTIVEAAKQIGVMKWHPEAEARWKVEYGRLRRCRTNGCERGRPQTLRLAMIYALADGESEIGLGHLKSALAVWDYCERSAKLLFGEAKAESSVTDNEMPLDLQLLETIVKRPGIATSELWASIPHTDATKRDEALKSLLDRKMVVKRVTKTKGRPKECWYPNDGSSGSGESECDGDGEAEGGGGITNSSSHFNSNSVSGLSAGERVSGERSPQADTLLFPDDLSPDTIPESQKVLSPELLSPAYETAFWGKLETVNDPLLFPENHFPDIKTETDTLLPPKLLSPDAKLETETSNQKEREEVVIPVSSHDLVNAERADAYKWNSLALKRLAENEDSTETIEWLKTLDQL